MPVTKVPRSLITGDIYGGTAGNTDRIVLPKDTKTNLDALTRVAGNLVFDTTSNKPYYDDGITLKLVGSGSGSGARNLIVNGSAADATASILIPYADATGTRPVDGTGGTPASVTGITTTAGGPYPPMYGTQSYYTGKGVANRQGEGYAIPFTVGLGDFAKAMTLSFDYISIAAAPIVAGDNTSDGDYYITIYDVTNSTFIEPSDTKLRSSSGTISAKYQAIFQTSATGTSYRLIIHTATVRTPSFGILLDNISVSPSVYVYGSPITNPQPYTPVLTNFGNGVGYLNWERRGAKIAIEGALIVGSTLPTGVFGFALPVGMTADYTNNPKGALNTDAYQLVGFAAAYNSSSQIIGVIQRSATSLTTFSFGNGTSSDWNTTGPVTWVAGSVIRLNIEVPILGWSSSVQMSDGYDSRSIVGSFSIASSFQSILNSTETKLLFNVKDMDTTNSYNTTTGVWTCPSSGNYAIGGTLAYDAVATVFTPDVRLYVNSGLVRFTASTKWSTSGLGMQIPFNWLVPLKVGDLVEIRTLQGSGSTLPITGNSSAPSISQWNIRKDQAPTTISATELVAANVRIPSGATIQALGSGSINFSTIVDDTHGSLSTISSGTRFTARTRGKYGYNFSLRPVAITTIYQYVNGVSDLEITAIGANVSGSGAGTVMLNGGEYFDIRSGAATTTAAIGYFNVWLIK